MTGPSSRRPQGCVLSPPAWGTLVPTTLLAQGCELVLGCVLGFCESAGSMGSMLGIFPRVPSFPDSLCPRTVRTTDLPLQCHCPKRGPLDGAFSCWVLGCAGLARDFAELRHSVALGMGLSGNRLQAGRHTEQKVPLTIAIPKDQVSRNAH